VRNQVDKRFFMILFGFVLAVGFLLPSAVMGAGDDCPPPTEGPPNDPSAGDPTGGDYPTGGEPAGNDGTDTTSDADETSSEGLFGSLGGASSSQITIGIMVVVGVIVGAVYLVMVSRMEPDE
jgi:hypothetical protein